MCLTLAPFSECHLGRCVNGSCVCNDGVISRPENIFKAFSGNTVPYCAYHKQEVLILVYCLLSVTIITFVVQTWAIETKSQARRLIAGTAGYPLAIAAYIIHIVRPDEPLWGAAIDYTLCFSLAILLLSIQFLVFISKYTRYLGRVLLNGGVNRRRIAYLYTKLNVAVAVVLTLATLLFNLVPHFEALEVKESLTKAAAGIYTICYIYLSVTFGYVMTKFLEDLKVIIATEQVEVWTRPTSGSVIAKCKKQIPSVKAIRIGSTSASFAVVVTMGFSVIWDGWLAVFTTVLYSCLLLHALSNVNIVRGTVKKRIGCGKGTRAGTKNNSTDQSGSSTCCCGPHAKTEKASGKLDKALDAEASNSRLDESTRGMITKATMATDSESCEKLL